MRRSEINTIIRQSDQFIQSFGFRLPPFAYWTPAEFSARRKEAAAIIRAGLGWDITDYGLGDFTQAGLFLFTLRNGDHRDLDRGTGMLYAEKIMIVRERQLCPMHRHNIKAEDIINRGGGRLVLEIFASLPDGSIDGDSRVQVMSDGLEKDLAPGGHLTLSPGESVTLLPGVWHAFWAEGADVLVGEVSTVNDDRTDNVFRDQVGRFPVIEEDEAPLHLLMPDYDGLI
jgi:D-lyxose ketol-isomerase